MTLTDRIRQAGRSLAAVVRRIGRTVRGWAAGIATVIHRAADRHRDRVADDPGYHRTVATAVSELVTTMVPRPTVAMAVAILLTGLLTPGHPDHPRPRTPRPYDPEPEYDSYPVARRNSGSPPPAAGSLWDRLH